MIDENAPPEGGEADVIDAPVEDTPVEGAEDQPQAVEPPSLEDVASRMGWSPQDEWRGDPDNWKPAHEFVQNTADINSKLSSNLKRVEQQVSDMARTNAVMNEKALADQRQELLGKRQDAFDTGDSEAFNRVDRQLTELQAAPSPQAAPPPEAQEFIDKHSSWWGKNDEATGWATNRAEQLSQQGISPARQLAIVEREMKDYFPDLLPQAAPKPKPAPLNAPGKRGGQPAAKKSYANLPPEAKSAADEFAKNGRCTVEQYADEYFKTQEA